MQKLLNANWLYLQVQKPTMDITTKYNIVAKIINSTDETFLSSIKSLVNTDSNDFWIDLSEADKNAINIGLDQLNEGKFHTHESVQKTIKSKFSF